MANKNNPDEFRLKNFHKTYVGKGGTLNLKEYKEIMQTFLREARVKMLEGQPLRMPCRLGRVQISRHPRNYSNPTINWPETNKYKALLIAEGKKLREVKGGEGHDWLVYYTDPYYYMYEWKKDKIKLGNYVTLLKNALFYELKPFRVAQRALTAFVKDNELATVIHELQPYK